MSEESRGYDTYQGFPKAFKEAQVFPWEQGKIMRSSANYLGAKNTTETSSCK